MSNDRLVAEVVFDRAIVGGSDRETLDAAADVLFASAPAWAAGAVAWSPHARERRAMGGSPAALPRLVEERTRWATGDRHTGSVELRGATSELNVVVSVNSSPLAAVGGRLLMPNGISVTALRKKVAGIPQAEWMRALLHDLCEELDPAWGALYSQSEYRAKVMADGPSLRAVGRDFARFLPGLFAVNYFGPRYVDLIGQERIERLGAAVSRRAGNGWLVDVIADPSEWDSEPAIARSAAVMERIGPEFFFLKRERERPARAPDWGG
ncbi:hypothetical protein [Streptomyces sp. NPDC058731]|uniref:hypothetical protein n=1 Tax=Streptomyces sp. NPDC058731 TaxID=3346613 RepID=UPI003673B5D0